MTRLTPAQPTSATAAKTTGLDPAEALPLLARHAPGSADELAELVRRAHDEQVPLYPIGGGTSLTFGMPPVRAGWGVDLSGLARVVDYPRRDMTITVEAGLPFAALAELLAADNQQLPFDPPQVDRATLGGIVATAYCGPRRFGLGQVRDYLIGLSAVDGRGTQFKAGGRVVKNVAGYDFCKLLTGSLGSLAVLTQLTFRLKPRAQQRAIVCCDLGNLDTAERLLAALVTSPAQPVAIELLCGASWHNHPQLGPAAHDVMARLVLVVEGLEADVAWMIGSLRELIQSGGAAARVLRDDEAERCFASLVEFAAVDPAEATLKFNLLPSRVCQTVGTLLAADPHCTIQAHAGSGILLARLSSFDPTTTARLLTNQLHPAAIAAGGHCLLWSSPQPEAMTRQAMWGPVRPEAELMRRLKAQFDPQGILNPGRFYFDT